MHPLWSRGDTGGQGAGARHPAKSKDQEQAIDLVINCRGFMCAFKFVSLHLICLEHVDPTLHREWLFQPGYFLK